jgi:hypothetical protein
MAGTEDRFDVTAEWKPRLEAAFRKAKQKVDLYRAYIIDDEVIDTVGYLFDKPYGRVKWQKVDFDDFAAFNPMTARVYLSPEAFRYYLPAFLLNLMRTGLDSLTTEWTLDIITPPYPNGMNNECMTDFEVRWAWVSQDESQSICAVLEWVIMYQILPNRNAEYWLSLADSALAYWRMRGETKIWRASFDNLPASRL